jgi:hypothetical protein
LEKDLSKYIACIFHNKLHIGYPGIEPGPPQLDADDYLSCGVRDKEETVNTLCIS